MGTLSQLLAALLTGLLGYLKNWYEVEEARTAKENVKTLEKKLESVRDTEPVEIKIRDAAKKARENAPTTVAEWNAGE